MARSAAAAMRAAALAAALPVVSGSSALADNRHVVFSCSPPGPPSIASLEVYHDASYSAAVAGQAWFRGGDVIVYGNGSFYGANNGSLRRVRMGPAVAGADNLGAFESWPVSFVTEGGRQPGVTVDALFVCYRSGLLAFNLTLPQGLSNTAGDANHGLVTQFPSFESSGALATDIAWLTNGGIWTLFELWGVGTQNGYNIGERDGPAWFYNTSFAPSTTAPAGSPTKPDTAILCALDTFKAMRSRVVPDGTAGPSAPQRVAWGVMGTVAEVAPGFRSAVGLWASAGINSATYEWGALMTRAYNTRRIPESRDVLNGKLSYWSDNGAVYFQSWWDDKCNRQCKAGENDAETLFTALKQHHIEEKLPYALYQLDTWWFIQGNDVTPNAGLDCADWQPRKDLFPNGLPAVTQKDIPLLLYSWGYVPLSKGQRMLNYTWVDSLDGAEGMPALDEMYSFYSMIRDRFLAYNGTSFEQDNMGSNTGNWLQTLNTTDGGTRWWQGFATPWCESNIPVQICESTASDLLESLKYNCITSTRDNIDDVPGIHQNHGPNEDNFLVRWHVGFDRMLIGALNLKPFFDNVWSTEAMPESTWGSAPENYTELAMALSVLGGGAVGIGDYIGRSNRTLIMACAMEDGTLLSPSRPSSYIDAVYLPPGSQPWPVAVGRVLQAPTFLPFHPDGRHSGNFQLVWSTVLAIDVPGSFKLQPSHLDPDLSAGGPVASYVALRWSGGFAGVAARCADGAPAAQCVEPFDADHPLELQTGVPARNYTHHHEIVSLSPVFHTGYSLLGELDKFVRVSFRRFQHCQSRLGAGGVPELTFSVVGAPGETLSIAVLAPTMTGGSAVRRVALSFPAGPGQTVVAVTCSGNGPAPCSVGGATDHSHELQLIV